MDSLACHVIYVNRGAREDRLLRADSPDSSVASPASDWQRDQVRALVQPLLDAFRDVHVCTTGEACLTKLLELQDAGSMLNMTPTIILLDMPQNEWVPEPSSISNSSPELANRDDEIHTPDSNLYGLPLLQRLMTEAHLRNISKLVIPIPVISDAETREHMTDGAVEPPASLAGDLTIHRRLVRRCLDLGAVDVLTSPLTSKCVTTLEICAYKAHRDASRDQQALLEMTKGRKRSWVGVNEQKPFAYLREAMVSGLMNGICRLSAEDDQISGAHIAVSSERKMVIVDAVGRWQFCAHSFSDDELLFAAMLMFRHALSMPELEHWRIPSDQLISFLVACRAAYNSFVPYHNFRHVVDVLQATFHFLVQVSALPPYPLRNAFSTPTPLQKTPVASLLTPTEALTLLVTAIDISNVARHYDTALKWMHILAEEFSRQASMEDELEITSSLMAPPKKDFLSLANAQLGFMNLFAIPLFQGVADVMPGMLYAVEQLKTNKLAFETRTESLNS
ncbi:hypothetical protein ESCO_000719 [Escovopsis weberi]|uniref:PDEase domain-containing protein n=1 Tax=Escovopsis weberi TaxID=150374 RepID=A0A0M9VTB1_ESCWE|nr:hypothetical protein ESCO_000719 [Escovopsis weberi]